MYGNLLEKLKDPFLYAAAKGGRLEECETLIELGANVNYQKEESNGEAEDGYSPLLIAARNSHTDIVTLLLANGADTQLMTKDENTALHLSSAIGDENLCSIFLQNNCSPYTLNINGKTPIDIAKEKGFFALGEWLETTFESRSDASRIMNNSLEVINSHYGQISSNSNRFSDLSIQIRSIKTPDLYNGLFESSLTENTDYGINYANEENESKSSQLSEENNSHSSNENIEFEFNHANEESDSKNSHLSDEGNSLVSRYICSDENNSTEYFSEEIDSVRIDEAKPNNDSSQTNMCLKKKCKQRVLIAREIARKAETSLAASESIHHKLENEHNALKNELESLLGKNLRGKNVKELEEIEKKLMDSLHEVKQEKEKAAQIFLQNEEKKHVCIICQSEPKCVLLMPCRHMCVCKHCSTHEELKRCPLCREIILQRIDVFS